jgi:hypothetical protein
MDDGMNGWMESFTTSFNILDCQLKEKGTFYKPLPRNAIYVNALIQRNVVSITHEHFKNLMPVEVGVSPFLEENCTFYK